jgi:hypothetical protein
MPIYEYYCPDNNRIYQFYAKTLAQGQTTPRCPDNPAYRMEKMLSPFAVAKRSRDSGAAGEAANAAGLAPDAGGESEDPRTEAAMAAMESEFANVDENDPRAMGRMMRRMAELSGEKIDGEMEEVVRKLEEGADPESLEEQLGETEGPGGGGPGESGPGGMGEGLPAAEAKAARHRFRARRSPPLRDPKLYDYE